MIDNLYKVWYTIISDGSVGESYFDLAENTLTISYSNIIGSEVSWSDTSPVKREVVGSNPTSLEKSSCSSVEERINIPTK